MLRGNTNTNAPTPTTEFTRLLGGENPLHYNIYASDARKYTATHLPVPTYDADVDARCL
jgi:hypothetical protein